MLRVKAVETHEVQVVNDEQAAQFYGQVTQEVPSALAVYPAGHGQVPAAVTGKKEA